MASLTHKRLLEVLDYNPKTGVFTWLVNGRRGPKRVGTIAGAIVRAGRRIRIYGTDYSASTLAHFWMTGRWPKHIIDHINRNPTDDRWINLRNATQGQNCQNRSIKRNHSIGLKGVSRCVESGRFAASIRVNGRYIWLGRFTTPAAAHRAYRAAAKKHFGAFARFS